MRPAVYKLYSNTFGVNISEALHEDLTFYPSLADFFARPLKQGIRQIDESSALVSPCDGTVLHFGTVHTEEVEQVITCAKIFLFKITLALLFSR